VAAPEVDVGRGEIAEALELAPVVVMIDEHCDNLPLGIARLRAHHPATYWLSIKHSLSAGLP
jgi:hypothetical protein